MDILRDELYRAARLWNNHIIRPSANPNPNTSHLEDAQIFSLTSRGVTYKGLLSKQLVCDSNSEQLLNCIPELSYLANIIMHENHWLMPKSPDEAKVLYGALIDHIEKL